MREREAGSGSIKKKKRKKVKRIRDGYAGVWDYSLLVKPPTCVVQVFEIGTR